MKKLRIVEPGWENFTGDFGTIDFVDGVSVEPVAPVYARRLANTVRVEEVNEDGSAGNNPSDSQRVIDFAATPAEANMNDPVESAVNPVTIAKLYSKDELMAMADAGGIAALRPIGAGYGVKSNSIAQLVDKILTAQQNKASPASVLEGLMGSSVQPAMFVIDGKEFTLGDIVRQAHQDSQMGVAEWNDQVPEAREALIAAAIVKLGAVGKGAAPVEPVVVEDVSASTIDEAQPAGEADSSEGAPQGESDKTPE